MPAQTYSDTVVAGRITDVTPGYGFVVDDYDNATGTPTKFDHPDALWRTAHLTVAVDRQLGAGDAVGDTVVVGYTVGVQEDFEVVKQGFLALGDVVLPLEKSPVFDYNAEIYGIAADGDLLTTVNGDQLSLPALGDAEEQQMLAGVDTYAELSAEAAQPLETVPANVVGDSLAPAE